jgi:hypothetical protein
MHSAELLQQLLKFSVGSQRQALPVGATLKPHRFALPAGLILRLGRRG